MQNKVFSVVLILCALFYISACKTKASKKKQETVISIVNIKLSATDSIYKVGKANDSYFIIEVKNNRENRIESFSFKNNIVFYAKCEQWPEPLRLNIYNDIMLTMVKDISANGFFQTTLKYDDLFKNKIYTGNKAQLNAGWYWSWLNELPMPPSPINIDKDKLCQEVFFWYVVKIYGKDYLSNKVTIKILK